jgi:putative transposase
VRQGGSTPEADIWHRRFWENTIADEEDFERHLDDIHDNPLKHGLVACAYHGPDSSSSRWVHAGHYHPEWGCRSEDRRPKLPADLDNEAGE